MSVRLGVYSHGKCASISEQCADILLVLSVRVRNQSGNARLLIAIVRFGRVSRWPVLRHGSIKMQLCRSSVWVHYIELGSDQG